MLLMWPHSWLQCYEYKIKYIYVSGSMTFQGMYFIRIPIIFFCYRQNLLPFKKSFHAQRFCCRFLKRSHSSPSFFLLFFIVLVGKVSHLRMEYLYRKLSIVFQSYVSRFKEGQLWNYYLTVVFYTAATIQVSFMLCS